MIMRELSNECENYRMNMREFSNEFEIGVERILYNQMNIGFIANICKLSNICCISATITVKKRTVLGLTIQDNCKFSEHGKTKLCEAKKCLYIIRSLGKKDIRFRK